MSTGKGYVGLSKRDNPLARAYEHITAAYTSGKYTRSTAEFYNVIKRDPMNVLITVLTTPVESQSLGLKLEAYFIKKCITYCPFEYNTDFSSQAAAEGEALVSRYAIPNPITYSQRPVDDMYQFGNMNFLENRNRVLQKESLEFSGKKLMYSLIDETPDAYNNRRNRVLREYGIDIARDACKIA